MSAVAKCLSKDIQTIIAMEVVEDNVRDQEISMQQFPLT